MSIKLLGTSVAFLLVSSIGSYAYSSEVVNCNATQCWGEYSYQKNCESAQESSKRYMNSCDPKHPSYQQCVKTARNLLEPSCTCASHCGEAVCTKFPANESDQCYEAHWR